MFRNFLCCIFIYIFINIMPLSAQQEILLQSRIDWSKQLITITTKINLRQKKTALPNARYEASQQVLRQRPYFITQSLGPLVLNSQDKIHNTVLKNPGLFPLFESMSENLIKKRDTLSYDLQDLTMEFQLPLFPDISRYYVNHQRPETINPTMDYIPTTEFSGIVIYVPEKLPVRGEDQQANLQPGFFPRIFDSQMRLLLRKENVFPEFLNFWGPLAYIDYLIDDPWETIHGNFKGGSTIYQRPMDYYKSYMQLINPKHREVFLRIGHKPLMTMASAIYGKNRTDIIIPQEDAHKILSNPGNIKLLKEGRIIVISGNLKQVYLEEIVRSK